MISQFFILSSHGDTILSRHYRPSPLLPPSSSSSSSFYQHIKSNPNSPPIFLLHKITYIHTQTSSLYLLATTTSNPSPTLVLSLLHRITQLIKDYCGKLSEEIVRKNFILIYEILDQILDFGFPQNSSTENLRAFIFNKPKPIGAVEGASSVLANIGIPRGNPKTTPSTAVQKSILEDSAGGHRNEIFVDIFEKLVLTFNSGGNCTLSEICGSVRLKSYLTGNPELRIAFNEDLVVAGNMGYPVVPSDTLYGKVVLDDVNFHESADLTEFDGMKVVSLTPPDGEFNLMNYRINSPFRAPFRVFRKTEKISEFQFSVVLRISAEFPETNFASGVEIGFSTPLGVAGVSFDWGMDARVLEDHAVEFLAKERRVRWRVKKFPGGKEFTLKCKIAVSVAIPEISGNANGTKFGLGLGAVNLVFEIPMYNVSGLQVRYLRILETSRKYKPFRWVRYVTKSDSYVCRF